MKLIVGLGNPGAKYNFTRHNFGFMAVDYYAKVHGLEWKSKFGALAANDGDVWLLKPQDFYNESGRAVADFVHYYKIPLSDVMVICDNFDLEFGKIRYRGVGSASGNNGLKSIDASLGTSEYPRLRLGTGNEFLRKKLGDVEFVLSKFTPVERKGLGEVLAKANDTIADFVNK